MRTRGSCTSSALQRGEGVYVGLSVSVKVRGVYIYGRKKVFVALVYE